MLLRCFFDVKFFFLFRCYLKLFFLVLLDFLHLFQDYGINSNKSLAKSMISVFHRVCPTIGKTNIVRRCRGPKTETMRTLTKNWIMRIMTAKSIFFRYQSGLGTPPANKQLSDVFWKCHGDDYIILLFYKIKAFIELIQYLVLPLENGNNMRGYSYRLSFHKTFQFFMRKF